MEPTLLLKITAAAAAAAFLAWQLLIFVRGERQGREGMLDPFVPRLENPRRGTDALGYPALAGGYGGAELSLSLFPDTLVLRTLPVLWLQARWRRPHEGRLRVTLDPTGTEYFLENRDFHTRFAPPASWQRLAEARGSSSESLHLLHLLEEVPLYAFPDLKSIEVDEQAVSLTFRCARADRKTYRVLRSARFEGKPVAEAMVDEVLEALREIEEAVNPGEDRDE
jgi:hypothetical protein